MAGVGADIFVGVVGVVVLMEVLCEVNERVEGVVLLFAGQSKTAQTMAISRSTDLV